MRYGRPRTKLYSAYVRYCGSTHLVTVAVVVIVPLEVDAVENVVEVLPELILVAVRVALDVDLS